MSQYLRYDRQNCSFLKKDSSKAMTQGMRTMFDMDINTQGVGTEGHVQQYTLFDLIVNHEIGLGTLTLGLENLLDKDYIPAYSQIRVWKNYQNGRGREVTLGYSMTF